MRTLSTLCLGLFCWFATPSASWAADPNTPHDHKGIAPKFTSKPSPTSLNAAEEAKLAKGEAVLKQVRFGDSGGRGVAIMDINASPDKIWTIIQDFPSYPGWVDGLEKCSIYKRAGEEIYVEFGISVLMIDVTYYIHHTYRPEQGYGTWTLDYSRKSDLDDSVGYWLTYESPAHPGWTRVEYTVDLRLSGWVPGAIEDMLANKGLVMATSWVKKQAEK